MKISVITVCFNAADFIDGCLRSVAEQTHRDIEHIVVDGLSRDTTVAIVWRYPHVARLVTEPDDGIYDAMNKGLGLVTGDHVLFLNADDRFASADSVARAVAAIEADPGADVYYGNLEIRHPDGRSEVFRPPRPADAPAFMVWGCLPHQSTLARPSVFARTGRFDLRYRYHADYDWFLKVLADPEIDVRYVNALIGSFRLGGASSQLAEGQPEVYAIQNRSPLYATPEWDKKRIEVLQDAYLRERLRTTQLTEEIVALRNRLNLLKGLTGSRGATPGGSELSAGALGWVRIVVAELGDAVRGAPRRLRWWVMNLCFRYLPDRAIDFLRHTRARWRGWRQTTDIVGDGYRRSDRKTGDGIPQEGKEATMRGHRERNDTVRADLD